MVQEGRETALQIWSASLEVVDGSAGVFDKAQSL